MALLLTMTSGKILNKNILMRKIVISFYLLFFLNFFQVSWSFEKLDAEKFVIDTTSKAKSIILDKDKNLKNKKELVENLAIEVVDVDGLGRFCIGSNINNLNEKQKILYKKKFRVFFSKNISSRLQSYSDQDIQIIGSEKRSKNYVLVKSKIISEAEKQEIRIDWRVFLVGDKLLIRDLVVEGLSLAKTQREEFSSVFANKGFDGLILLLDNFIEKN